MCLRTFRETIVGRSEFWFSYYESREKMNDYYSDLNKEISSLRLKKTTIDQYTLSSISILISRHQLGCLSLT